MTTLTLKRPDVEGCKQFFQNKVSYTTGPVELSHLIDSPHEEIEVVDVRAGEDYRRGHIPGAINLPRDQWESAHGLSKEKTNILYCYTQTCHLAAKAAKVLADKGFPVMEMEGGFETWKDNDFKIEK